MLRRTLLSRGKALWFVAVGLSCLFLWGCGPTALELDYGRSVSYNKVEQIVNPQAGLDPRPAVGLSPEATKNNLEKYDKSFKEEKKGLLPSITTQAK